MDKRPLPRRGAGSSFRYRPHPVTTSGRHRAACQARKPLGVTVLTRPRRGWGRDRPGLTRVRPPACRFCAIFMGINLASRTSASNVRKTKFLRSFALSRERDAVNCGAKAIYRIGSIEIDVAQGCLRQDGQEHHLRPKSFQVLREPKGCDLDAGRYHSSGTAISTIPRTRWTPTMPACSGSRWVGNVGRLAQISASAVHIANAFGVG
jgi:hypothetical protein